MAGGVCLLLFIALVCCLAIGRSQHLKRLQEQYGKEWEAYNAGAFRERVVEEGEKYDRVMRLADELESSHGQKAVRMSTGSSDGGIAIHHINKNGTFSARGPYFISRQSWNWKHTGRTHLILTRRGKKGEGWFASSSGFVPDHYNQKDGYIAEAGLSVAEYATTKYRPISIEEFVEMKRPKKTVAAW